MRGKKQDVYEGGIKVPGFAHWPEKIKPGKIKSPMHIVDWLPTLAQLIGHKPKTEMNWDGVDQSHTIFGSSSPTDRDMYWVQKTGAGLSVMANGKWSAIQRTPKRSGMGAL